MKRQSVAQRESVVKRWFGTDGIRGPAGVGPLAPEFLVQLGRALGEEHRQGSAPQTRVLIGRDTRSSGPAIVAALVAGLAQSGARALDLGVIPTAALGPALRARGAALGLMVSASHNPWQDNGVKVFGPGGLKLADEREAALEARVAALGPASGQTVSVSTGPGPDLESVDGAAEFGAWLAAHFRGLDLSHFRLAVDCAHGSAYDLAPRLLRAFGAQVTPLFCEPDGRNINAGCGSTHLEPLAATLRGGGHDLGLAFDGDADRVLFVDATGRTADGDCLLGFLGPWLDGRGELPQRTVVASIMSNLGLQRALTAHGLTLVRCPVGDRHVLAALQQGGYGLGGEASGHVLLPADGHFIGDGLFSALTTLRALAQSDRSLGEVIEAVPRVPQVLLNVPVPARPALDTLPGLSARAAELGALHGENLRIVLRYSGTESLARVMVEGLDAALVQATAAELAALWPREIEALAGRSA
ncbi:MAG: phosphoglucosamine mutase [Planctomycetota bacterium]